MYPGNDIQGWMRPEELQWLYAQATQMVSIVEVGAWKGRSTHALVSACPGQVVAVDTWKVVIQGHDPQEARRQFVRNMKSFRSLRVMKTDSRRAAARFDDLSVDMVFIDADHNYESVVGDILAWRPKARRLICGHDYKPSWPGVQRAVNEVFGKDIGVFKGIWFHHIKLEAKGPA